MSFPIGRSVEENVTIRALKGLEHCIAAALVAYMIIVSQQSESSLVILNTPPSKFIYISSIHNVYLIKENVQVQKLLNNWNIVRMESLELERVESIHSFLNKVKVFEVCSTRF